MVSGAETVLYVVVGESQHFSPSLDTAFLMFPLQGYAILINAARE